MRSPTLFSHEGFEARRHDPFYTLAAQPSISCQKPASLAKVIRFALFGSILKWRALCPKKDVNIATQPFYRGTGERDRWVEMWRHKWQWAPGCSSAVAVLILWKGSLPHKKLTWAKNVSQQVPSGLSLFKSQWALCEFASNFVVDSFAEDTYMAQP